MGCHFQRTRKDVPGHPTATASRLSVPHSAMQHFKKKVKIICIFEDKKFRLVCMKILIQNLVFSYFCKGHLVKSAFLAKLTLVDKVISRFKLHKQYVLRNYFF